jgi:hypothetical protein
MTKANPVKTTKTIATVTYWFRRQGSGGRIT